MDRVVDYSRRQRGGSDGPLCAGSFYFPRHVVIDQHVALSQTCSDIAARLRPRSKSSRSDAGRPVAPSVPNVVAAKPVEIPLNPSRNRGRPPWRCVLAPGRSRHGEDAHAGGPRRKPARRRR
jgi:hypothetical protein